MRVLRSRWGNVIKDGVEIHHQVRVLQDDQSRVAVFASKSSTLLGVYNLADVTVTMSKAPGCMCKEPSQHELARVWKQSEAVTA